MNANQEAKLKMYRATENYCGENSSITASNVAFRTAFNNFKANIASIVATVQADGVPLTGITVDKNIVKQALCEKTAEIAGIVYAYASTVGSNTLKAEVNCLFTSLMRMREDALAPRCQSIHDITQTNLAVLADYGITATMLTDLQELIQSYALETPKSRTAISERKTTTANLAALFDETDAILRDRMDKLVMIFKSSHPDFVKTYETTRRTLKPPTTTTQLKVCVTDKATKSPIKNAIVTAAPNNTSDESVTIPTDSTGEALFKPTPHGIYNVTITSIGYTTYTTDQLDVKMGEINKLDVELVK
ncbi:MAG TPA: carboxypeptidase-like regulatory domain-containing protein [Pyrinomonadaceae bacterium]|jgi:hypothetical protein